MAKPQRKNPLVNVLQLRQDIFVERACLSYVCVCYALVTCDLKQYNKT